MIKLGDKKGEFKERRIELYIQLQQANIMEISVRRFEYVYRQIHILTQKIKTFKGGLNYETE